MQNARYRIRTSKLFLTYPQCQATKEAMYDAISERFPVKEVLVAHELHANGDDHLHCYVELKESMEFNSPQFADLLGYHGNYQSCRSGRNVLKYCCKRDDYKASFDVEELMSSNASKRRRICEELIQGRALTEVVEQNPTMLFGYKKLKTDVEEFRMDRATDQRDDLPCFLDNPWGKQMPVDTDYKRCHYWVYSKEPNRGKTTAFLLPLLKKYKAILKDQREPYWKLPVDTEMILFDEVMKGDFKAQDLNRICDGTKEFRIFQGGCITLLNKPLLVICSNFSINEVFPFMNNLVHSRFNEIEIV